MTTKPTAVWQLDNSLAESAHRFRFIAPNVMILERHHSKIHQNASIGHLSMVDEAFLTGCKNSS